MQDNFLLIFKSITEFDNEPMDAIWLEDIQIQNIDEHQFSLQTRNLSVQFAAASETIKEAWMTSLSFVRPWYEDEDLEPFEEIDEITQPVPSFSLKNRLLRLKHAF